MTNPRAPNYVVMVKPKRQNAVATKIGVGWMDHEGRLSIKLNPCTVLHWKDDLWISLYPDRNNPPNFDADVTGEQKPWPKPPTGVDDIPF